MKQIPIIVALPGTLFTGSAVAVTGAGRRRLSELDGAAEAWISQDKM